MSKSLKRIIKRVKLEEALILTPRLDRHLMRHPELVLSEKHADLLRLLVTQHPRDRTQSFSGSAAGQCYRKQVFDYIGVPQRFIADTTLIQIFRNGTWVHLRWQMTLLEAGLLDAIEVVLPHPNEWRLMGSMDGIGTHDRHGEFMFELKGWSALVDEPKPEHVEQIHRYMLGSGIEVCSLIYEHKSSQNWREFIIETDPVVLQRVKDELELLNNAVEDEVLPDILPSCSQRTGETYRGCPYRTVCLDIADWDEAVQRGSQEEEGS